MRVHGGCLVRRGHRLGRLHGESLELSLILQIVVLIVMFEEEAQQ